VIQADTYSDGRVGELDGRASWPSRSPPRPSPRHGHEGELQREIQGRNRGSPAASGQHETERAALGQGCERELGGGVRDGKETKPQGQAWSVGWYAGRVGMHEVRKIMVFGRNTLQIRIFLLHSPSTLSTSKNILRAGPV
jgi:hypothetical protein